MDTILEILSGESYSGIRALVDLSTCIKYSNSDVRQIGAWRERGYPTVVRKASVFQDFLTTTEVSRFRAPAGGEVVGKAKES